MQKSPAAGRMGRGLQKVCLDTADTAKNYESGKCTS